MKAAGTKAQQCALAYFKNFMHVYHHHSSFLITSISDPATFN